MRDAGSTWSEIAKVRYRRIWALGSHKSFETKLVLLDVSEQNRRKRQKALVQSKLNLSQDQRCLD